MSAAIQKDKIEVNGQIIFSLNGGLFVGRITEVREKAIKVDYTVENIWSNSTVTVFTYTTFLPLSVIIYNEIGALTVKKWFTSKFDSSKAFHIKKYFMEGDTQVFI